MGFFARFVIAIGIVYWLSPEPVGYGEHYQASLAKNHATEMLSALIKSNMQTSASRDDVEALAVKAGKALAALDPETRKALIDQFFSQSQNDHSVLRSIIN